MSCLSSLVRYCTENESSMILPDVNSAATGIASAFSEPSEFVGSAGSTVNLPLAITKLQRCNGAIVVK